MNDSHSREREERLFAEALEMSESERPAFLIKACVGDEPLRLRLLALLAAHAKAERLLPSPLVPRPVLPAEERAGDVIDRYKLLQKIGEGGCGVVWMAEQEEPVRRRVALKVIKLGMDTKEVIGRFESERQALAMMDHPNIAKVFDAGATANGRPFFVMELVRGVPITRHCDEALLNTEERLKLFVDVCHAIQHAHQKGIIHRDIKPSNILVTQHDDVAVPKVIDFGIAKATQGPLTDKTVFTAFEQFIGTPAYMSPEQAEFNALDVDTRSDVYSLGVLLYELLTGRPPFDPKELAASGLERLRQCIREVDPPKPSSRLRTLAEPERTTLARQRRVGSEQLVTKTTGDLDWIVMKALEKNRRRRYESASAFASDVLRHLGDEPVEARPPTKAYLLAKGIRRHRVAFITASVVVSTLILGVAASTWQAVRASRAEVAENALRTKAETERLAARRRAYAGDMNFLQQALASNNFGRALELLNRQRPQPGEVDLRGWEWRYLWQFCRSESTSLLSPAHMPEARLAVSSDGRWLATAQSLPDCVKLWDVGTRQSTSVPLPANGTWPVVVFVPNQPWLLIAVQLGRDFRTQRGMFRLWNYQTQEIVKDVPLDDGIEQLMIADDGKTVVSLHSGSEYSAVWSLPDLVQRGRFAYMTATPYALTRDARRAAQRSVTTGLLELVDCDVSTLAASGDSAPRPARVLWTGPRPDNRYTCFAFSRDGKILAAGFEGVGAPITLYEVDTGKVLGSMSADDGTVNALAFWEDGKTLASSGTDQTIRIWNLETRTLKRTLRGHTRPVTGLVLLPDQRTLVSSSGDGTVRFWDATAPSPAVNLKLDGWFGARWYFTPDSKSIVANVPPTRIERLHGPGFAERTRVGGEDLLAGMCLSGDGSLCAAVAMDANYESKGVIQVWNVERNQLVQTLPAPEEMAVPIAFTPEARTLLVETLDKDPSKRGLSEWDVATGKKLRSWPRASTQGLPVVSEDQLKCLIRPTSVLGTYPFYYDGDLVLPHEYPCSLIDLKTGVEKKLGGLQAGFRAAHFSRDGRFFVAATGLTLSIWDTETFQQVRTIEATGSVLVPQGVNFSPDGDRIVAVGSDAEAVRFWDVEGGEQVLTLPLPGAKLAEPAFSPDGTWLGALSRLGGFYLWHAPSWAEIEAAEGH